MPASALALAPRCLGAGLTTTLNIRAAVQCAAAIFYNLHLGTFYKALSQVLRACDLSPVVLANTVAELDCACSLGHSCPPSDAFHRLVHACKGHNDVRSLKTMAGMVQRTSIPQDSDSFRALNDCYNAGNNMAAGDDGDPAAA